MMISWRPAAAVVLMFVVPAAIVLTTASLRAAPPSRSRSTATRPTTSRPSTQQGNSSSRRTVPNTQSAPTTKQSPRPIAPQSAKPGGSTFAPPPLPQGSPQPPQPRREEDAASPRVMKSTPPAAVPQAVDAKPIAEPDAIAPKPAEGPRTAIPHPAIEAEVKSSLPAIGPRKPSVPGASIADDRKNVKPDADGKYLLRYHFSSGETIRWTVEHKAKIVTSVQGTTQTAETFTRSTKVWRVVETLPGGETKFVHLVEAIDMRQKLTGRQETTYDSTKDKDVPPMFAEAAKQVGVPLAEVTVDVRGNVLKRADRTPRPEGSPTSTIMLVLPDTPLAVGESWTAPFELSAVTSDGKPKPIKARNRLTLEKVEDGIAYIRNETQILSPLDDPQIEAQVVQSEQSGTVSFDLRRGRIVRQNSDLDKEVFGFQGPESKLHYTAAFAETLEGESTTDSAAAATADSSQVGKPVRY